MCCMCVHTRLSPTSCSPVFMSLLALWQAFRPRQMLVRAMRVRGAQIRKTESLPKSYDVPIIDNYSRAGGLRTPRRSRLSASCDHARKS